MSGYATKRPGEETPYALDWSELEAGETLAEDLGWLIVPQELDAQALTLVSASLEADRSAAVLSGGRPGHVYHVSQRVRTSAGRVLSRGLLVRVIAG